MKISTTQLYAKVSDRLVSNMIIQLESKFVQPQTGKL